MSANFFVKIFLVVYFFLVTHTSSRLGIWIRPSEITQGQVILASGSFLNQSSLLSLKNCFLEFRNKKHKFFLDSGFQFVSRIPIDVFVEPGLHKIKLKCSNRLEKTYQIKILSGKFPLQEITLTSRKATLRTTAEAWEKIRKALETETEEKLWNSKRTWSLPNDSRISTIYGVRRKYNGIFAKNYFHRGIDFAGKNREPIKAPSSGKIILTGKEKEGFHAQGNCIFIDHGQGLISTYYHLSKIKVKKDEFVDQNQIIGEIGSTGISTGPHLHFGLYYQGVSINPDYLFKKVFL